MNPSIDTLFVPDLPPVLKHPTIFKHFDALDFGQAFRIMNDHDPKPLYYQLIAERGNVFTWKYIQNGPQWWEVEIAKNAKGETVGELAAKDIRKANVFKKYGIDFCCGGKKSLQQACEELGIDPKQVQEELNAPGQSGEAKDQNQYHRWQPDFLADYIYNQHHVYYYEEGPVIADLLEKVVGRHGMDYPFLNKVKELYGELQCELKAHFLKEEKVLFPFIRALAEARRSGDTTVLQRFPDIREPMQMMEMEHEVAGDLLKRIRDAAQDYKLPAGACNSFTLLYQKLQALEEDLHQHIHLENNLLFPKAVELEKRSGRWFSNDLVVKKLHICLMLSTSCKYALRAVLYLMSRSGEGVRLGIKEVAREVEANEHTTGKILQLLAKEGVIHSVKGPNGGFSIGPDKPLYFMDVVRIIDGEQFFTRCGLGLKSCSEKRPCPIHHQFKVVREELHRQFCTLSVQELSRDLELGKSFLK